jgi:hypothetical protein
VANHVAFRRLDLDDVGALVGQQHGAVRAEDDVGEVDDPDAFERAWHFSFLADGAPRLPSPRRGVTGRGTAAQNTSVSVGETIRRVLRCSRGTLEWTSQEVGSFHRRPRVL